MDHRALSDKTYLSLGLLSILRTQHNACREAQTMTSRSEVKHFTTVLLVLCSNFTENDMYCLFLTSNKENKQSLHVGAL